jgi:hypothetical protein
MIDSPAVDAGETTATEDSYSLIAPPFSAGGVAVFAPKEQQNLQCGGFFVPNPDGSEGGTYSCLPALGLTVDVSLKAAHSARIPGSIGAFHVPTQCYPDSTDPKLQKGCDIMSNFFASLGPKGFKVYDVRLEPSSGRDVNVLGVSFRNGFANSPEAWVTKRGAPDDGDNGTAGNISNTRVRLQSNGTGDITANGLCPVGGCDPAGSALHARLYCGGEEREASRTVLHLNGKGDGKEDLIFSLPCADPAVLIIDGSEQYWVAAPAIQ